MDRTVRDSFDHIYNILHHHFLNLDTTFFVLTRHIAPTRLTQIVTVKSPKHKAEVKLNKTNSFVEALMLARVKSIIILIVQHGICESGRRDYFFVYISTLR